MTGRVRLERINQVFDFVIDVKYFDLPTGIPRQAVGTTSLRAAESPRFTCPVVDEII